MKTYYVKPY